MKKYSWWAYDDEYITGWQYFGRNCLGIVLCLILVGLYLISVTAYKRAKSLGHESSVCRIWGVWGFCSVFLALIPGPTVIVTNTIPHWYLWFSNGKGPKKEDQENEKYGDGSNRDEDGDDCYEYDDDWWEENDNIQDVDFEKDDSESLKN